MPNPIRVLVVEDSAVMSELLIALLESDPAIKTIGVARNGREAIEMVPRLHPDLVTMDVWMPLLDGFATVEHIMAYNPLPILVVTSATTKRDVDVSLRMLTAGALDVIEKPSGLDQQSWQEKRQQLVDKVKLLARVRVVTHLKGRHTANLNIYTDNLQSTVVTPPDLATGAKNTVIPLGNPKPIIFSPGGHAPNQTPSPTTGGRSPNLKTPSPGQSKETELTENSSLSQGRQVNRRLWQEAQVLQMPPYTETTKIAFDLIAVASSTGGPQALMHVLKRLPAGLPVPILIVQHIAAGFTQGLVDWLDSECDLKVREAKADERALPGIVYIAPDARHLTIERGGILRLAADTNHNIICPSADVLMHAVAQAYGPRAIGIILTGMGRDGAQGMKAMHEVGAYCIAQDEASSVIFGMPKVAIGLGAINDILPIDNVADRLIHLLTEKRQ